MLTTFSAVPVLPEIEIGKVPKTPEEVPFVECVAAQRPSRTACSAAGSTPASRGGEGGNCFRVTGCWRLVPGCSTPETTYGVTSLPPFAIIAQNRAICSGVTV